jgi:hypothetical protein
MERDFMQREQISDSCRVIKSHASFVGTAAGEVKTMPADFVPDCMAELDETESVLRRALVNIQQAKGELTAKQTKKAA